MNGEKRQKPTRRYATRSAKECAYIATFVALLLAAQLLFSTLPGVEAVTALFVAYAFSFGVCRGVIAATAFSLLRQLLFGFFPTVLVLYLLYYNFLAVVFGLLGRRVKTPWKALVFSTSLACVCTVGFTMLDNVVTPWFYAYSPEAARAYFFASLPFMATQTVCVGVSNAVLFLPLWRAFRAIRRSLSTKNA